MKDIAALEGHRERIAVLPFRHSKWVNKRIEALSAQGKVNKDRLWVFPKYSIESL